MVVSRRERQVSEDNTGHGRDGLDEPEARTEERGTRSRWRVLAGAGAALVVLAVLAVLALTGGPDGSTRSAGEPTGRAAGKLPTATSTPTVAGPTPPAVFSALTLGRDDAPVTIVEFGDYQCPNCGQFAREIKPRLVREYVDKGVVRLMWRDFPFYGEQSVDAAVAARAAGRQGEFWAYHDALYANQAPPRSGKLTSDHLRGLA
ncbi:MAG: thioredoxin domain-containing protein [Streptosporangiales bacterium]|nr:thioredoxin domain-containing protein [Streptosporangiales bacterium]